MVLFRDFSPATRVTADLATFSCFARNAQSALFASPDTGGAVSAKLASEEIEGDFMTVWARNFAEHMKEWSGGKINIEVYPYGTLGAT